jgi:hypothetical protein
MAALVTLFDAYRKHAAKTAGHLSKRHLVVMFPARIEDCGYGGVSN